MGYPVDHKLKTREKIITSARKLWKTKGYAGASVDTVMKDAGLTRGGFYAHFQSKDDLLIEALSENMVLSSLEEMRGGGIVDPKLQRQKIIEWYLSSAHCDDPGKGCALTSLTQEAARMKTGPRQKISSLIARFANWLSTDKKEENGMVVLSLMVGAITLARAVGQGELSDKILNDARQAAEKMQDS